MKLWTIVGLILCFAAAPQAAQAKVKELELRLIRALGTGTDVENPDGHSLLVDLRRNGDEWDRVWALHSRLRAMRLYMGRVVEGRVDDEQVSLRIELLQREPDGRLPGDFDLGRSGLMRITVDLKRDGEGRLEGRYEFEHGDQTVTGRADGRFAPPRPALPDDFSPIEPDERPRMPLRKADLPTLRDKAQTPLGETLMDRIGRAEAHDAVGAAVKYQITGDRQYAEQARQFTLRQMQGHPGLYSHRSGRGRPPQHVAMAYDLCHDAWDEEFRSEVRRHLLEVAHAIQQNRFFVGGNHHVASNWSSHIYSALGFIAMALWGEKGPAPAEPEGEGADLLRPFWEHEMALWRQNGGLNPEYQLMLEEGRYRMYWFNREGAGEGGFHGEIAHYGSTALVAPMEFAVCYRRAFGEDVSPWPDITMVVPRRVFAHHFPDDGSPSPLEIGGWGRLSGHHPFIEIGFPLVPERWQPALLWAWNRLYDFDEPDRPADDVIQQRAEHVERRGVGGGMGIGTATWVFLNYPFEMQPKPPAGTMPLTWQAPAFGYYGWRSGWQGDEDYILQVFAKQQRAGGWNGPNAGTFRLFGLGRSWSQTSSSRSFSPWGENRVMLPGDETHDGANGRVTHVHMHEDGSGSLSIDMSDIYNPRDALRYSMYGNIRKVERPQDLHVDAMRAMAVDYGGESGAPCLFVLVDRIEGGGEKVWTWNLGDRSAMEAAEIEGHSFTVQRGGGVLRGRFISPEDVSIEAKMNEDIPSLLARGGDHYFLVATLGPADADPPRLSVEGRGLDARVTVGDRLIRFDGERVIIEPAPSR